MRGSERPRSRVRPIGLPRLVRAGRLALAAALAAALPAFAAEIGPAGALGGRKCTFGAPRVVATADKPSGPFSVKLGLAAAGGALAWLPDDDGPVRVLPVGPHGEPLGPTPVAGGGVALTFRASHLLGVEPVGAGFLVLGWGFSDLCPDACVIAQALDGEAAPVGPPAVLAYDAYLDAVAGPLAPTATGADLLVSVGKARALTLVHATVAGEGAQLRPEGLGVASPPANALLVEGPEGGVVAIAGKVSVTALRLGGDGAVVVGAPAAEGGRIAHLSLDGDGAWVWFPEGYVEGGPSSPPYRRAIDAAGALGPPVPVAPAEAPWTAGRTDVGSAELLDGTRVEGLLLYRRDLLGRWASDPQSLAVPLDARIARDLVAMGDRWVAAWVGKSAAGWQVVTREARCPR